MGDDVQGAGPTDASALTPSSPTGQGWTRLAPETPNPFSLRAEDYAFARPPYPDALTDWLRELGVGPNAHVADLGCGTGLLAERLLPLSDRLYGVEPSRPMLDQARKLFAEETRFIPVEATAEATGLPTSSVDLVSIGQALHWFDRSAVRQEIRRILRPKGSLLVAWTVPAEAEDEARTREVDAFVGGAAHRMEWHHSRRQTWEKTLRGARSASFFPLPGDETYETQVALLREAFEREAQNGEIIRLYRTRARFVQNEAFRP